jgi:hypothetical protein
MKKLSIAFLAAMALVSFACKKKGGGGEVLGKMTEFKDRICACKDKACADQVSADMSKWMQDQTKAGVKDEQPNPDDVQKTAKVSQEMTTCMTKFAEAAPPPPAGDTPPAAGSADPAAGGTPPAGGAADPAAAAGGTVPAGSDAPGSNVDKAAQ